MLPLALLRALRLLALTSAAALAVRADLPSTTESPYALTVWETEDGLPHNSISAVIQRHDGFLWVATQGGLVRFDGLHFNRLNSPLIDGAKSSSVVALLETDADALLIGSIQSGLLQLRNGELTIHPLTRQFRSNQKIANLFPEGEGVFWIVFTDREAWRCRADGVEKFPAPPTPRIVLPASFARDRQGNTYLSRGGGLERYSEGKLVALDHTGTMTITSSRTGGIWVATGRRLARLDDGKLKAISPVPWTGSSAPWMMYEENSGALWLSFRDQGLLRWQDGSSTAVPTSHVRISDFREDNEGNLWVATAGGGLNRLRRPRMMLVAEEPNWTSDVAGSVCEDAAGDIWFVNRNVVRKIPLGEVGHVGVQIGFPKRTLPVCGDAAGNLWIGAAGEIFRGKAGAATPPVPVGSRGTGSIHVIYAARDGGVWIGRNGGPLERFQGDESETFGRSSGYTGRGVRSIGEDAAGHLWVGTEEGLLFEKDGAQFEERAEKAGLPPNAIRAILGDAQGDLWLGTAAAGIFVRHDGHFAQVTEAQGLLDNVISQILEDDFGWLWFGSRRGIFKVRKRELLDCAAGRLASVTPVIFGRSDGLSGISAVGSYQPTAWKTRRGQLWFVTRKGLVTTDPADHEMDRPLPSARLERVLVDGRPLDRVRSAISSAARKIEFQFTAPTYTAPEKVRFRYRLDGFDSDWSEGSTLRSVAYPSLPPGKYSFTVVASDGEAGWAPEGATVAFQVLPRWWQTWWARFSAIGVATLSLVSLVRYWSHRRLKARLQSLEQERRVEEERVRIARDLHDDLGASLTQASMMAEELSDDWDGLPNLREQSSRLAERVRVIARDLDAVVWTVSPKNDRLSSLSEYLCHFADEYFRHSTVECRACAAPDIPALPLSPELRHHLFMIAKELLNNVIKHAQASRVELKTQVRDGLFELFVTDDGIGFSLDEAGRSSRNGLRNLRARVAELGGELEIESSRGGTKVVLRMPVGVGARKPSLSTAVT
jgi:signal transduction histidine kinase/ligand-binding sensor domain-containing protein